MKSTAGLAFLKYRMQQKSRAVNPGLYRFADTYMEDNCMSEGINWI